MMARIRTVKPEFFQQEELAYCSPHARLLAIAVLQLCDANGVFRLVPMQVHAHAFPWEAEVNIRALIGELEKVGYLETYTVDGKEYGYVDGFRRHQRLTGKEAQTGGYYPLKNEQSQEDKHRENTGVSQGSTGEASGKHLGGQEQGTGEQGNRNREDGEACASGDDDWTDDAALYRRGKAILGQSRGSTITNLKTMCGDVFEARRIVEASAEKDKPLEYVNGAIQRKRKEAKAEQRRNPANIPGYVPLGVGG